MVVIRCLGTETGTEGRQHLGTASCSKKTGNVFNRIGRLVCGGIVDILMENVLRKDNEEDGLEVGIGGVQEIDSG